MLTHLACTLAAVSWIFSFHLLWARQWTAQHYKRAAALTIGLAIAWLAALLFTILLINDAQGALS